MNVKDITRLEPYKRLSKDTQALLGGVLEGEFEAWWALLKILENGERASAEVFLEKVKYLANKQQGGEL